MENKASRGYSTTRDVGLLLLVPLLNLKLETVDKAPIG